MSLVDPLQSVQLKGRRQVKIRIFKPWDIDCLCVPFRGWMSKTKYVSVLEQGMVVGASRTCLWQELKCCWVFHAQQFSVWIKNGRPPKGHPVNLTQLREALESTWATIPVERCWPTPCRVNIRKVFLMFGIVSVFSCFFSQSSLCWDLLIWPILTLWIYNYTLLCVACICCCNIASYAFWRRGHTQNVCKAIQNMLI